MATPLLAVSLKIDGPSSYQLQAQGLTVRITTKITNTGATTSAALQVQLWAFALPYNPAAPIAGYKLATVDLAALAAGAAVNLNTVALYSPPASGSWNVALFAEEASGAAFVIRDFFNFSVPLPVPETLAVYAATAVLGVPVPVTLENLLVDPSRAYWVRAGADRIDSVALAPGSQPGVFTTLTGGNGLSTTMVQDGVNLYALLTPAGVREGEIFRISKASGAAVLINTVGALPSDGPIAGAIGIQPQGGTLYFRARRDLILVNPATFGNFVPSVVSQMSTQGGSIVNYGISPPFDTTREPLNASPTSIAADFTNFYWLDGWDRTLRQFPLIGGQSSTVLQSNLAVGANFLRAPTHGPAGGNLFWIEGNAPTRALKRRVAGSGGVVTTVVANVASTNYAIAGDRIYYVSGVPGQAQNQLCSVSIDGGAPVALLAEADTATLSTGEVATDGNAVYWIATDTDLRTRVKRLVLPVTGTPLISQQPQVQNVAPNSNVHFVAQAASGGLSYIWFKNGQALVSATGLTGGGLEGDDPPRAASVVTSSASTATLTLTNVTASDMGFYFCRVTNSAGTTDTSVAILTVETGGPSRLINVSTRGQVLSGGNLTPGFVMRGTGSKQLLVRAVGPTLGVFGLTALSDTKMDVFNQQTGGSVLNNDDWGGGASLANTFSSLGAFALGATSKDAASFTSLPVNQSGYSVRITAAGAATSGLALAEIYDADPLTSPAKLANVSTLGFAGVGADALTPGFVIGGTAPKQLLIRAIGPGLAVFGVGGTMVDPRISVIPLGMSLTVAGNDDWAGTAELKAAFTAAGAFSVGDTTKDAALVVRLPPGGYSVVVSGANNTTGTVLVEVYDLDP